MNKQTIQPLILLYRVEPGCLGPQGSDYIDGFCDFAAQHLSQSNMAHATLQLQPRRDKTLDEMLYKLSNKRLTDEQVSRYFHTIKVSRDDFEEAVFKKIATLIEQYLGRA